VLDGPDQQVRELRVGGDPLLEQLSVDDVHGLGLWVLGTRFKFDKPEPNPASYFALQFAGHAEPPAGRDKPLRVGVEVVVADSTGQHGPDELVVT
jgi:hypothetical protein